ncbi:methylmalonyl Co-A mutase-associated GTPase MeaB [Rhodohalobacter sp. 614A]|uniref:methylmalonyl Co-A mutase-associated GTPase MeaB n=1 Tax=Rhodohalobacter sp. 614A TaxID=2908649 RepID=UPI001F372E6A|nr:methylmalonyl Co-A mutase-associated GTPase MeaB [Rhodohalobacter sp. 614A]
MPKTDKKSKPVFTDSINPNFKSKSSSIRGKQEYIDGIRAGNRTVLSQAITLIESTRAEYRELGEEVLEECLADTGNSVRIGITGVPGVGKSTFIESLGKLLLNNGRKLAVLTIDPSSSRSRGSILGDKTRMPWLSAHERAYIRPSPSGGTLGGVARKTRETILLCEAAGFDTIFVETVGVGQSETTVQSMVDFFLLLMLAGAGDELQGIKRGIMEMADLIAINKADQKNINKANQARQEYKNALSLFPAPESGWEPPVLTCSALEEIGLKELWEKIQDYLTLTKENGYFEANRKEQAVYWMYESIQYQLKEKLFHHPAVKKELPTKEKEVEEGKISSFKAATELLELFNG